MKDMSADDKSVLGASIETGAGAVSSGMTVIESSSIEGLVPSDCELSSSLSDLSNNCEDSTVRLVLMNLVS